jgi:hypothetical protein
MRKIIKFLVPGIFISLLTSGGCVSDDVAYYDFVTITPKSFTCGDSEQDALARASLGALSFHCSSRIKRNRDYYLTCEGPLYPFGLVCIGTPGNVEGIKGDPTEQFTFPKEVPFPKEVRWDYRHVIDDQEVMRPILTWP